MCVFFLCTYLYARLFIHVFIYLCVHLFIHLFLILESLVLHIGEAHGEKEQRKRKKEGCHSCMEEGVFCDYHRGFY